MPVVKKETGSAKKSQPVSPKKPITPISKPVKAVTPAPKQPVKSPPVSPQVQGGQAGMAKLKSKTALPQLKQALLEEQKRQKILEQKEIGRAISRPSKKDIGKAYLQPNRLPVEFVVGAKGSPLAQDMLYALKHEGKPQHLSDEVWLKRFARYGRDEEETEQASKLLALMHPKSGVTKQSQQPFDPFESLYQIALNDEPSLAENFDLSDLKTPEGAERFLEQILDYNIEFGANLTDPDDQLRQLQRLAVSNLEVIDYINNLGLSGLDVFRDDFSRASDDTTRITVVLGDNSRTGDPYKGYVPLPTSSSEPTNSEWSMIYLGSDVSTSTITHEFFHQLDRHFDLALSNAIDPASLQQYLRTQEDYRGGLGLYIDDRTALSQVTPGSEANIPPSILLGRAHPPVDGEVDNPREIFADMGMTAILAGKDFYLADNDVTFTDPNDNLPIGWNYYDSITNPYGSRNAALVEIAMQQYFYNLLANS